MDINLFGKWCNENGYYYLAFDMWEIQKGTWQIVNTDYLKEKYLKESKG